MRVTPPPSGGPKIERSNNNKKVGDLIRNLMVMPTIQELAALLKMLLFLKGSSFPASPASLSLSRFIPPHKIDQLAI
jgi:hypothetical protein